MTDSYASELLEAFPEVDPGVVPLGSRILVQIKTPRKVSKGGIYIGEDTRETEKWNTQVAKIISLGPLAFKNRDTQATWPEGEWVAPGDFIRCPKYGGDRFSLYINGGEDEALFVVFNDLDLLAKITGDPLAVKAFL